jgi:uncharacterized membrane protein YdjX (TVP38/TMEM64 family)
MAWRDSRLQARHWIGLAFVALVASALVAIVFVKTGASDWLRQVEVTDLTDRIRALGPWVFFGALAVLPAFGFPVTPFYLVAGKSFGLPLALFGSFTAVAINLALSYGLARSVLHPAVVWLVERTGRTVPQVRPEDRWMLGLLMRVTPGPPFFVQSYALALGGLPFGVYMAVSVAVSWLLGGAVVVFGETLLSGNAGKLVIGICAVIAAVVIVRLVRRRLQAKAAALQAAEEK